MKLILGMSIALLLFGSGVWRTSVADHSPKTKARGPQTSSGEGVGIFRGFLVRRPFATSDDNEVFLRKKDRRPLKL
jgi:hypothetical protein